MADQIKATYPAKRLTATSIVLDTQESFTAITIRLELSWTYGNGPPGEDNSTNGGLNMFYGDYPIFVDAIGNGVVSAEHY